MRSASNASAWHSLRMRSMSALECLSRPGGGPGLSGDVNFGFAIASRRAFQRAMRMASRGTLPSAASVAASRRRKAVVAASLLKPLAGRLNRARNCACGEGASTVLMRGPEMGDGTSSQLYETRMSNSGKAMGRDDGPSLRMTRPSGIGRRACKATVNPRAAITINRRTAVSDLKSPSATVR